MNTTYTAQQEVMYAPSSCKEEFRLFRQELEPLFPIHPLHSAVFCRWRALNSHHDSHSYACIFPDSSPETWHQSHIVTQSPRLPSKHPHSRRSSARLMPHVLSRSRCCDVWLVYQFYVHVFFQRRWRHCDQAGFLGVLVVPAMDFCPQRPQRDESRWRKW